MACRERDAGTGAGPPGKLLIPGIPVIGREMGGPPGGGAKGVLSTANGSGGCNACPHMKRNTLEKLYLCLRDLKPRLDMDAALMDRARIPIERMLSLS